MRRLVQGRAMLLHLRLLLLMHGLFSITFVFFCFFFSFCTLPLPFFFIAWTDMVSGTMVTSSITIRTYLFLLWERVSFLNCEFGRCCSEGFINITSLVIDSIGDGRTSPVSLNREQIHLWSNFSKVCRMEI